MPIKKALTENSERFLGKRKGAPSNLLVVLIHPLTSYPLTTIDLRNCVLSILIDWLTFSALLLSFSGLFPKESYLFYEIGTS